MSAPRIDRQSFTFDLVGHCIYCEKPCKRSRTFVASSLSDAQSIADAAMSSICHRKCGGY